MEQEDIASVHRWFEGLADCMRAADYAAARPLFAEDVVAFGSVAGFLDGREALEAEQWRRVWGDIEGTRFPPENLHAVVSGDRLLAVGFVPFESRGFHEDGTPFDRPGRATVVLGRPTADAPWVARHVHFSLVPGVPARSYGPVPA